MLGRCADRPSFDLIIDADISGGGHIMHGRTTFVSLSTVLQAIGSEFVISDEDLAPRWAIESWRRGVNERYIRTSRAAALLDHLFSVAKRESSPRWFDYREGTGYPRLADSTRVGEGQAFLLEEGKWYWEWKTFQQNFHAHVVNTAGRWHKPPTDEDYAKECPARPIESTQNAALVEELSFDLGEIIDFLNHAGTLHSLRRDSEDEALAGRTSVSHILQTSDSDGHGAAEAAALNPAESTESTKPKSPKFRGPLAEVLKLAWSNASDKLDSASVFEAFKKLARSKEPPDPLLRYSREDDAVVWVDYEGDDPNGEPKFFTRDNMRSRSRAWK